MKRIAIALLVVAAIAFVAVGQTDEELAERLGLYEGGGVWITSPDQLRGMILNTIVDRIEALEDYVFLLHKPKGIINLYGNWFNSDADSAAYVEFIPDVPYRPYEQPVIDEPEIGNAEPWKPSPIIVFTAGAVLGAFLVLLVMGK